MTYDHGFEIENDKNEELATALWRAVFQSDDSVPDKKVCKKLSISSQSLKFDILLQVLQLANYVRKQMKVLYDVPTDRFLEGDIDWLDPPMTTRDDMLIDSNVKIWRPTYSATGKLYYWNIYTRESRWKAEAEPWEAE